MAEMKSSKGEALWGLRKYENPACAKQSPRAALWTLNFAFPPRKGPASKGCKGVPDAGSALPPTAPTSEATPRAPLRVASPIAEPLASPNGSGPASARAPGAGADSVKVFVRKACGATQISRALMRWAESAPANGKRRKRPLRSSRRAF